MNSSFPGGDSNKIHCLFFDLLVYPEDSQAAVLTSIITCAINIIAGVGATFGTTVVLLAFCKTKELREVSNIFLISLVCTDLLVGLIVDPLYVIRQVRSLSGWDDCGVWVAYLTSALFCTGASFLNLTLIGVERCMAILLPFHYVRLVTERRVIILIAAVWFIWIIITLLRFAGLANRAVYLICLTVIGSCYFINAIIYFKIFREARRHQRRIQSEQCNTNQLAKASRERKLAKTMVFIFGSLLVCYTPGLIVLLIRTFTGDTTTLLYIAYPWAENLVFLNSALNPLIYCWRNRDIRRGVFQVLHIKRDQVMEFSWTLTAPSRTELTQDFRTLSMSISVVHGSHSNISIDDDIAETSKRKESAVDLGSSVQDGNHMIEDLE